MVFNGGDGNGDDDDNDGRVAGPHCQPWHLLVFIKHYDRLAQFWI